MNKTEAVTIIRSLLSSSNSTFGIYTLNKEFKNETGIDIPLFGYCSLSDFLESIPDTVKLTGVYPIQKVSLVNNETSGHIVSLVKRQRRDKKTKTGGHFWKSNSFRFRDSFEGTKSDSKENEIPSLVPGGIPLQKDTDKIRIKAKEMKKKKPNPRANIESNSDEKPPDERKPDFRFRDRKFIKETEKKSSSRSQELNSSPTGADVPNPPLRVTPDASQCFMEIGEEIARVDLKVHAKVGYYVEVFPCEISHPGFFYLHLRKFKKPLAKFMDKLQKFYNEHEEIPNLTGTPIPGRICAVLYSRHGDPPLWHRVRLEQILTDCLVVVRFIDYGSTAKILVKNLKALHRDFRSLPQQAVAGTLANIKPSGGRSEWSETAIKRFHELAFCRDLIAGVVAVEGSLNVALSATEGEEVHVNDTLVEEGHAEFDLVEDEKPKTERKESERSAVPECELPSPVFFLSKNCNNSRLQKMFSGRK